MMVLVQAGNDNRAGQVLASKYRLEELLGSGGMGHVYRATNELVGRPVAIKLLRPEHAANEQVVERFLREARAANLVRHPNVVDVLDIGKDEGGSPFIVQELLKGQDLAHYAQERGRLSLDEVVDLICPVIDAIAEAHTQGVVHRDLKPENVFLARDPGGRVTPKLLDFGISKVRATGNVRATEVGVMMGTPAYMPPEQLQGARDTDARSDVWALGVMLFELLSGRLPFVADEAPALFVKIATQDAPKLSEVCDDVPPNVSKIVERCLRRKPDERYPTAAELARDLRLMADGQELEATGKRSIPPELLALVPKVDIPASPIAPTIAGTGRPHDPPPAVRVTPVRNETVVPDLELPPPKTRGAATATKVSAQAPAPPPAPAPPRSDPTPPPAPRSDPRLLAPLPGVMLGPTTSAPVTPRRATPSVRDLDVRQTDASEMSWVFGLCVIALVAIGTVGVLMSVAHRPEGFAFMRMAVPGSTALIVAGQSIAALVAAIIGWTRARRALRTWNGDEDGTRSSAVIGAIVAGALIFAAIELVRGAF